MTLQGKTKEVEAKAEYLKLADQPFEEQRFATCRDVFLNDLKNFEALGIKGIDYAKVRGWLK